MRKAESLRAALTAAIPELAREPDRLKIWVENGAGLSRMTGTLAFGFTYRLNALVAEASTDIALFALAIFRWLRVNQPNLLTPGAQGFAFDADILDNRTADILFQLDLAENVTVQPADGGGYTLAWLDEPDPLFDDFSPLDDLDAIPPLAEVLTQAEPEP